MDEESYAQVAGTYRIDQHLPRYSYAILVYHPNDSGIPSEINSRGSDIATHV